MKKKSSSKTKPKAKPKKKSPTQAKNTFGIIPIGDRILIEPLFESELKTESGIIIPETIDKEKPERGKVVAVGEGKYVDGKLQPIRVKVGDKVVFSKYGFDEVKIGGTEYYILREENILAVIK